MRGFVLKGSGLCNSAILTMVLLLVTSCIPGADKSTEVTITQESIEYAEMHFSSLRYTQQEYQIAISIDPTKETFSGIINDWISMGWEERQSFLPNCFDFPLPEEKDNTYYELIARYPEQFGYGWDDESHENDTLCWSGDSANLIVYREMIGLN